MKGGLKNLKSGYFHLKGGDSAFGDIHGSKFKKKKNTFMFIILVCGELCVKTAALNERVFTSVCGPHAHICIELNQTAPGWAVVSEEAN